MTAYCFYCLLLFQIGDASKAEVHLLQKGKDRPSPQRQLNQVRSSAEPETEKGTEIPSPVVCFQFQPQSALLAMAVRPQLNTAG